MLVPSPSKIAANCCFFLSAMFVVMVFEEVGAGTLSGVILVASVVSLYPWALHLELLRDERESSVCSGTEVASLERMVGCCGCGGEVGRYSANFNVGANEVSGIWVSWVTFNGCIVRSMTCVIAGSAVLKWLLHKIIQKLEHIGSGSGCFYGTGWHCHH